MNKPVTLSRTLLAGMFSAALAAPVYADHHGAQEPTSPGHNPPQGEPTRELEREVAEAGRDAAQYVGDATITAEIKARYAADDEVSMLGISVETEEGVVQLSGFTPSPVEKSQAERIARDVDGVTEVHNDIVIRAEKD